MGTSKGGARPGAGRKAGGTNSVPPDIKQLARRYAGESIQTVYNVMKKSKLEGNRIAAAQILMDRGFGKPSQALTGDPDMPVELRISWLPPQDK